MGPSRAQVAQLQREARRQAAEDAFQALVEWENRVTTLHLEAFAPTVAPPDLGPEPVNPAAVLAWLEDRELAQLGRFDFGGRREAKRRAQAALPAVVAAEQQTRAANYQAQRSVELAAWTSLAGNDPGAVLDALEAAFADNESQAVAINCEPAATGAQVSLVVLVGTGDQLPDRKPTRTAAGAASSGKRTKKELADLYTRWVASTVLATVKEAFAVAPGVTEAQVAVIRRDPGAVDPAGYLSVIYAGRFHRQRMANWNWRLVDAVEELLRAPEARLNRKGANREIVPLDLTTEPDLAALLQSVREASAAGQSLTELADRTPPPVADTCPHIDDIAIAPLVKGANTPVPTTPIQIILAWAAATAGADLDVSALLCGPDGRVLDPEAMVFYNQPVGAGGAVRSAGREQPSATTSTDTITIDLPNLPREIAKVMIAVSLDGSGAAALAQVGDLRVAVTTDTDAVAFFPITGLTAETAAVAVEIYHRHPDWKVRAVGQGWADGLAGLARDFGIDVSDQ